MALIYSWILGRIQYADEKERQRVLDWLLAPDPQRRTRGSSQRVVDEELAMFGRAAQDTGGG